MEKASISEDILRKAKHCKKDHRCIRDPDILCRVKTSLGSSVLIITPRNGTDCEYFIKLGNAYCTCPVRIELFSKYDV